MPILGPLLLIISVDPGMQVLNVRFKTNSRKFKLETENESCTNIIFKGGSRAAATSKMERFVIIVNG